MMTTRWTAAARTGLGAVVALLTMAAPQPAMATWQGASSGSGYTAGNAYDYDAVTNWVDAVIDDSFSGFALTDDLTVTLDANRVTGAGGVNLNYAGAFGLTLNGVGSARTLTLGGDVAADTVDGGQTNTIGGGTGVLLNLGTENRNVTIGEGDVLVIANAIANTAGGITKLGPGLLQFNAANLYTGLTQVDAGELRWNIANALSSGGLTINSGGTVNLQTFADTVGTVTLNQGGAITGTTAVLTTGAGGLTAVGGGTITGFTTGALALGGALTYTNVLNDATFSINRLYLGGSRTFTIADGDDASGVDVEVTDYLGNAANANHNLTKDGAGVMQLSGALANGNRGTGTTLINDGTLLLNKSASVDALGGTGLITVGDGTGASGSAVLRHTTASAIDQIVNNAITVNGDGLWDLNGKSETTSGALIVNGGGQVTLGAGSLTTGAATMGGVMSALGAGTYASTAGLTVNSGGSLATAGGNISATTITVQNGGGISTGGGALTGTGALVLNGGSIATAGGNFSGTTTLGSTGGGAINAGAGVYTMAGNLTYTAGAPSNALVITAGQLNIGTVGRTFTVADEAAQAIDVDIQAGLAGTGNLTITKAGAGTLRLGGASAATLGTGGLTINASGGRVILENAAGSAIGSGTVTISAGTELRFGSQDGQLQTNAIVNSGMLDLNGRTATAGALTHNAGASIVLGAGSLTVTAAGVFAGSLTGNTGSAFSTGGGALTMSGLAYVAMNDGSVSCGPLTLTANNAVSTGGGNLAGSTLAMTGGSIDTGVGAYSLGGNVTGNSSTNIATIAGHLDLGGTNRIFTIADNATANPDMDIAAAVGNGTLSKAGAGQLRLSGTTPNTAALAVSAGTLQLGKTGVNAAGSDGLSISGTGTATLEADDQIADDAGVTASGGTLNLQGFADTVGAYRMAGAHTLAGTGTLTVAALEAAAATAQAGTTVTLSLAGDYTGAHAAGSATWNAPIALAAGTNNFNQAAGGTSMFNGAIGGAGAALHVNASAASGILDVRGVNTYGGGTTVSAGTLLVNNSAALGSGTGAGNVVVQTGATLGGYGKVDGQVSGAGTIAPGNSAGILTVGSLGTAGGIDFGFELGSAQVLPTWGSPASPGGNDVLYVQNGGLGALTGNTTINVNFTGSGLGIGQKCYGGFFTTSDHRASLAGATFTFSGLRDGMGAMVSTRAVTGAGFVTGSVDGYVTSFELVRTGAVARTVFVSENAFETAYSTYNTGYSGQAGTAQNPFGSISAAYHFLYNQTGNHEILLVGDGDGIFRGGELGFNENSNGDGYLRMVSGNQFPATGPLWTSVTLKPAPDYEGQVTLRMKSLPEADLNPAEGTQVYYPAAYEKEVSNPNGANTANRGGVIRGLWNPGSSMPLPGMFVEGLTIMVGGGHVLIGGNAAGSGIRQNFTFSNCEVYLEDDVTDDNGGFTGDPWRKAALFVSHMPEADLALSSIHFKNSTIYLKPSDNSAWSGNFYVGQGWGSGTWYKFPNGMIDGTHSSYLKYWDGAEYVEWEQLSGPSCGIWQSGRNAGNSLTAYQNGAGANNTFLVNFNDVPPPPPPTGPLMIVR